MAKPVSSKPAKLKRTAKGCLSAFGGLLVLIVVGILIATSGGGSNSSSAMRYRVFDVRALNSAYVRLYIEESNAGKTTGSGQQCSVIIYANEPGSGYGINGDEVGQGLNGFTGDSLKGGQTKSIYFDTAVTGNHAELVTNTRDVALSC
jgi:hypothetical protein